MVTLVAVLAIALVIGLMTYWWSESRAAKAEYRERDRIRQHDLAVEEQRTMQVDACKGNPEMLKLVRGMQR